MRVDGLFLAGIGVFFAVIGVVYWTTSYEDAGFLMLIGSALLGLLPGSYYLWWSYKMKPQPDDDPNAEMSEGAGAIDSFPGFEHLALHLGHGGHVHGTDLRVRTVAGPPGRHAHPVGGHRGHHGEPPGRDGLTRPVTPPGPRPS